VVALDFDTAEAPGTRANDRATIPAAISFGSGIGLPIIQRFPRSCDLLLFCILHRSRRSYVCRDKFGQLFR